jgi:hypothetical protein
MTADSGKADAAPGDQPTREALGRPEQLSCFFHRKQAV